MSKAKTPRRKPVLRTPETAGIPDTATPIHGYTACQIRLPDVPFKVDRTPEQRAQMAMDDAGGFPYGGYLGGANTVGGATSFGLYFPGYPYLAERAQRSEFRQPVETLAKEMTRKWIKFKSKGEGDKSDKLKQIEDDFESFKIREHFCRATELDGFYGLGMIHISIAGQESNLKEPLLIDKNTIAKDSLNGFTTIEPMWVTPLVWNSTNPTVPDFYKPKAWMVLGQEVHQDRLLNFASREIPDIIKPAYNFGGLSMTQMIEPYVDRWLRTVDSVNRLINNFSIIVFGTQLESILEGPELRKRMALFTKLRSNQGMFMRDKEREILEQLAVPLSGLSDLQAQALEHMAYPTHEPLVVLTGITPSGLNASSEGDIQVWHDWIHAMQERLYTPPLKKILNIIQLNRFGVIDPDIVFDYVPLLEVVGEAAARIRKMAAEAGVAYIDAGVIDRGEERERIAEDRDSGYDNLSADDLPELPTPEELMAQAGQEGDGESDNDGGKTAAAA